MWKRIIRFGHAAGCTKNETIAMLFLAAILGSGWTVRWIRDTGNGPVPPLESVYRVTDSLFAARASSVPDFGSGDSSSPRKESRSASSSQDKKAAPSRPINVNTATAAELCLLPGVGPSTARKIVDHRTRIGRFRRIEELLDVPSIGPAKLEKLRPCVTIK